MEERKFAIIKTGGKQYRVSCGELLTVDRIDGAVGALVTFNQVLALGAESVAGESAGRESLKLGSPLVDGAKVVAKVVSHDRSRKVVTFRKGRRTGFTKRIGHRQEQSSVLVESISGGAA